MFSERLKQLRKLKAMTQQELADALGFDRTTVTKYETHNMAPPLEAAKKICAFFEVSLDYMMDTKLDGQVENALDERVKTIQRAIERNNLTQRELQDILDYATYRYPGKFKGLLDSDKNERH